METSTLDSGAIMISRPSANLSDGVAAALSVHGLTVHVDDGAADGALLSAVSLRVGASESVGLIGASGSGKTRLLYAALGVKTPGTNILRGTTSLFGRPLVGPEASECVTIAKAPIGYIAQDPFSAFVPDRHLGRQIGGFVAWKTGVTRQAALGELKALLPLLGLADSPRICRSFPGELSGGQLQRLQVAMAILARPRLIVADEPTASLDADSLRLVVRALATYRADTGCALLVASHDLGVIRQLCDVIFVLDRGCILESGNLGTLASRHSHPVTQWLLSAPARLQDQCRQE